MDSGIWATWYDIRPDAEERFVDWLHDTYLPALTAHPGHAWAANYRITGGGEAMDQLNARLARPEDGDYLFIKKIYERT